MLAWASRDGSTPSSRSRKAFSVKIRAANRVKRVDTLTADTETLTVDADTLTAVTDMFTMDTDGITSDMNGFTSDTNKQSSDWICHPSPGPSYRTSNPTESANQ